MIVGVVPSHVKKVLPVSATSQIQMLRPFLDQVLNEDVNKKIYRES